MAKLVPDSSRTKVIFSSSAEERFYLLCQRLPDPWRVYYSRTLSALNEDEGLQYGEIDFVLYHPRWGVIVVEVKGGRIRFDAERQAFQSINRHGEVHNIKNPFQQVMAWKSRLIKCLRDADRKLPVSHAVCLPSVIEEDLNGVPGVDVTTVIGKERMVRLEHSLKTIVEIQQPDKYLRFDDCGDFLETMLAGESMSTRLHLHDYIESQTSRVNDVESMQESLLVPITSSERLGIEGEAGTGKSLLAIGVARSFRDQGLRVLLLASNDYLNDHLVKSTGAGVFVLSYVEFAASYGINFETAPDGYKGTPDDWVQYEGPERLKKAVANGGQRFDVLICDEAQDVQPFWWEAFESVLDPSTPEKPSRFYIFFDRSQGVFGSGGEHKHFVPEEVLPVKAPYFPLVNNYRNTREIAGFSRHFRTGKAVLQSYCGRVGYAPKIITYKDKEDCQRKLDALCRSLTRDERVDPKDMAILSARAIDSDESVLKGIKSLGGKKLGAWRKPGTELGVSTVQSFKGMETGVGIIVNISEYHLPMTHPIMASLVYVACTRAQHMLFVFVRADDEKRAALEAGLAGIEKPGIMVVDRTEEDFVYAGRITHFNPDRMGWLEVDDPSFTSTGIMVFPADLKAAGIAKVKVGQRMKFRPRSEGSMTIAADLGVIEESVIDIPSRNSEQQAV